MTLSPKDQAISQHLDVIDAESKAIRGLLTDIPVPPQPPAGPDAKFTYADVTPPVPLKLRFTATPAGMPKYEWDWGTGAPVEVHTAGNTATNTWPKAGKYTVGLRVTDAAGNVGTTTQSVDVGGAAPPIPPQPPTPSGPETIAKPPLILINSSRPTVTGKTINVAVGGDFQKAIDSAQPGDEVVVAMGGRYVANYNIPQKSGSNGWVTVRADVPSQPEGQRRAPTPGAPIFESPNNLGVFTTAPGAARYRFIGIEARMPGTIQNTGLIRLGVSETSLSDLPRQFVFDQVYVHGDAKGSAFRRAFMFNGVDLALVDSFIADCHQNGSDSQAVAGWNGPGPFKIFNSYLEAASENVIFGGADPSIAGLIPGDIEIRRCHMYKPLAWLGVHDVKNLFELKNAQRVVVEGNVMENNWASAQSGSAINLKAVNQGGTAPWSTTRDVLFRYNIVRNMGSGFNLTGRDPGATVAMERVTIIDNLVDGMFPEAGTPGPNGLRYAGDGRGALVNSDPVDLSIIHNTIMGQWNSAVMFGGPDTTPPKRLSVRDNIMDMGLYGVKGPGMNTTQAIAVFMADGRFIGNVLIGPGNGAGYPTGNFFPATEADVGFTSPSNRKLLSTSKYKGKATDGRDPGADIDAVMAATSGVVQIVNS